MVYTDGWCNGPTCAAHSNVHENGVYSSLFRAKGSGGHSKSAGNPRCAVPAEIHSICTDRRDLGPAAGLQVSPTSDTCQSVAILMNRRHFKSYIIMSFPDMHCSRDVISPLVNFKNTKSLFLFYSSKKTEVPNVLKGAQGYFFLLFKGHTKRGVNTWAMCHTSMIRNSWSPCFCYSKAHRKETVQTLCMTVTQNPNQYLFVSQQKNSWMLR